MEETKDIIATGTAPATPTPYRRRPIERVSRKKYGVALTALRGAMAAPELSWRYRLRAVELYLLIHGLEPSAPNRRDRKTVKGLISESAFDKEAITHTRRLVLSQTAREARQEAERQLVETQPQPSSQEPEDEDAKMLREFWAGRREAKEAS